LKNAWWLAYENPFEKFLYGLTEKTGCLFLYSNKNDIILAFSFTGLTFKEKHKAQTKKKS
jgi:hypothetical protein